jgi:uncharacterized protein
VQIIELASENIFRIGVISDTHGLFREEIKEAFKGVNLIIHAGDIGKPEIINSLEQIAPVIAVRGNVDIGKWCMQFPVNEIINIGGRLIYLIHNLNEFDYHGDEKLVAVIFGHSHKPLIKHEENTLFFNPGSAGTQRFSLPISAGMLEIKKNNISAHHIELK